jgi:predicted RNA-binding protein YlqC (UPF0109 family)
MTAKILADIVRPALAYPEMYRCVEEKRGPLTIYTMAVHGADYGRVCGKSGANLEALNTVVQAVDENARVILSHPLTGDRRETIQDDPTWDPRPVSNMLRTWHAAAEAPGSIEISSTPRVGGTYDVFMTDPPPVEVLNALAKWASVAARARGGKVRIDGAHYATF